MKERSSKKGKKKEREPADKPSVKSKIKKKALVLPLEASIVALLLLIMLGAFYVVCRLLQIVVICGPIFFKMTKYK